MRSSTAVLSFRNFRVFANGIMIRNFQMAMCTYIFICSNIPFLSMPSSPSSVLHPSSPSSFAPPPHSNWLDVLLRRIRERDTSGWEGGMEIGEGRRAIDAATSDVPLRLLSLGHLAREPAQHKNKPEAAARHPCHCSAKQASILAKLEPPAFKLVPLTITRSMHCYSAADTATSTRSPW